MTDRPIRLESVTCRTCGRQIPVTRDDEPNRCATPGCPDPETVGKFRLLEMFEEAQAHMARQWASYEAMTELARRR